MSVVYNVHSTSRTVLLVGQFQSSLTIGFAESHEKFRHLLPMMHTSITIGNSYNNRVPSVNFAVELAQGEEQDLYIGSWLRICTDTGSSICKL